MVIITNKHFSSPMESFLTNEGHININEIITKKGNKSLRIGNYLKLLTNIM